MRRLKYIDMTAPTRVSSLQQYHGFSRDLCYAIVRRKAFVCIIVLSHLSTIVSQVLER